MLSCWKVSTNNDGSWWNCIYHIDLAGNWLLEPIRGEFVRYYSELDMFEMKDGTQKYLIDEEGNKIKFPNEEVVLWINEMQGIKYGYLLNGELQIKELLSNGVEQIAVYERQAVDDKWTVVAEDG